MPELAKHYAILGLPNGASFDEVKKAYHKLALIHHPDKGGNPQQFQQILEAFKTIEKTPRVEAVYLEPSVDTYDMKGFYADFFRMARSGAGRNPSTSQSTPFTMNEYAEVCRNMTRVAHRT
jgi:DnaJ-class molecular chaperone